MVKIAVGKNGSSLKFASTRLQGDMEIVEEAVKNDRYALNHASWEIRQKLYPKLFGKNYI